MSKNQNIQLPTIEQENTALSGNLENIDIEKLKQSKTEQKRQGLFKRKKKDTENIYSPSGHPIDFYMQENRYAEKIVKEIKQTIKKIENSNLPVYWTNIYALTEVLKDIDKHFRRKEEILFPYLDSDHSFGLINYFLNLHKEIRKTIRNMGQAAKNKNLSNFKSLFVSLNLLLRDCILKEEQTLFPTALSQLSEDQWREIRSKGGTVGYAWLEVGSEKANIQDTDIKLDGFRLDSGFLKLDKIEHLINHIPLEITIINHEDILIYYNKDTEDRIFPRSINQIGKKYSTIYSSKDAKKVGKIISNFKRKKTAFEEFYFQKDNAFIYVKYQAIFGKSGEYQGLIEIVQDIKILKQLNDEKTKLE